MKYTLPRFIILIISLFVFLPCLPQEQASFPFNPYVILKTWNTGKLKSVMGAGTEIMASQRSPSKVIGYSYPYTLMGIAGRLEFTIAHDSIERMRFLRVLPERKIDPETASRIMQDTAFRNRYNRENMQQDSLRQDSVVLSIAAILGPPLTKGKTSATEKNARYSAVWVNKGYACLFKEFVGYSEIGFSITTAPINITGEYQLSENTEIIRKMPVSTKKMSWMTTILAVPAPRPRTGYTSYFLLLEFTTGQRYLESLPTNPIGYLPDLRFEDLDGDAIPEAWISVPADTAGRETRHYIYSLPFREPDLGFNSDETIPTRILCCREQSIEVTFPDGTVKKLPYQGQPGGDTKIDLEPRGFSYLNTRERNSDGSSDFTGGFTFGQPGKGASGTIEITYRHINGGWETGQVTLKPSGR